MLFHLLSKLYDLGFSEWAAVFGDAKMTAALLDRLTHRCHILETGNDNFRFEANTAAARTRKGEPAPTDPAPTPKTSNGSLLDGKPGSVRAEISTPSLLRAERPNLTREQHRQR